jgi:hypothetical protein
MEMAPFVQRAHGSDAYAQFADTWLRAFPDAVFTMEHVEQRNETMCEVEYNLLFRWFVGLNIDYPVWDATVFSKNRDRLLRADVAALSSARSWTKPRPGIWSRTNTSR